MRTPTVCPWWWRSGRQIIETAPTRTQISVLVLGSVVASIALPPLAYGATWQRHGFSCESQQSGVKCTKAKGHGFELARGSQAAVLGASSVQLHAGLLDDALVARRVAADALGERRLADRGDLHAELTEALA